MSKHTKHLYKSIEEGRHCPNCGDTMTGPDSASRWSCENEQVDENDQPLCALISCKFDSYGENPFDIIWECTGTLNAIKNMDPDYISTQVLKEVAK